MSKFDRYAFSASPSFDEAQTREAFSYAVPLKTLVIYCYDPRAAEIPQAVTNSLVTRFFQGKSFSTTRAIALHRPPPCSPSSLPEGGPSMHCARSPSHNICFGIDNVVVVHYLCGLSACKGMRGLGTRYARLSSTNERGQW